MADDYKAGTSTTGTVTVGGSATGDIERKGDVDWFAVELVAGRTYVIDLEGAGAGTGTLGDTMLWGLFDAAGGRVAKRSRDGGEGNDARMTFTATESGTFYIAARGQRKDDTGTYTVRVRDQDAATQTPSVNTNTPQVPEQTSGQQQTPQPPADPDATAAGAAGLGNLAGGRLVRRDGTVDGGDDVTDYYSFTLGERQTVTLSLRRQDANADLYLEDGDGTVLASSTAGGNRNEGIERTLDAGTYYVRVAAQEAGDNDYTLRAKASDPAPDPTPPPQPPGSQQQNAVLQRTVPTSVSEPDDGDLPADTSTTGRILVGDTVTGRVQKVGDHDWFKVDLKAGKVYRLEMKSKTTFNEVGPYEKYWDLDVANHDIFAPTWLIGSTGSYVQNAVGFFKPNLDGTYHVAVAGRFRSETGTYTLQVVEVSDDFGADKSTAGRVAVGGSIRGEISYVGDHDWFAVTLEAGQAYDITRSGYAEIYYSNTDPAENGTLRTSMIRGAVHDDNGGLISGTEYYGRPAIIWGEGGIGKIVWPGQATESKRFTPDKSGTYYVSVSSAGDHDDLGTYTLSVSEADAM